MRAESIPNFEADDFASDNLDSQESAKSDIETHPYEERPPASELLRPENPEHFEDGTILDNTTQKLDVLDACEAPEHIRETTALLSQQYPDFRYLKFKDDSSPSMDYNNNIHFPFKNTARLLEGYSDNPEISGVDSIYTVISDRLGLSPIYTSQNPRLIESFILAHETGHFFDALEFANRASGHEGSAETATITPDRTTFSQEIREASLVTTEVSSNTIETPDSFRDVSLSSQAEQELFGTLIPEDIKKNPRRMRQLFLNRSNAIYLELNGTYSAEDIIKQSHADYRKKRSEFAADAFAVNFIQQNIDQFVYDATEISDDKIESEDRVPFVPGEKTEVDPSKYDTLLHKVGDLIELQTSSPEGVLADSTTPYRLTLGAPLEQGKQLLLNYSGDLYDSSLENTVELGAIASIYRLSQYENSLPSQTTIIETTIINENGEPIPQFFKISTKEAIQKAQVESDNTKLQEVFGIHEGSVLGLTCVSAPHEGEYPKELKLRQRETRFGCIGGPDSWDTSKAASAFDKGARLSFQSITGDHEYDYGETQRIYQEGLHFYVQTDIATFRIDPLTRGSKYLPNRQLSDEEAQKIAEEADDL